MMREYEQYYYTWVPAMRGVAVYAASAAGDEEALKNLCRSVDFDAESDAPTYRLTYCAELGSFVFLCARRMAQSLDGRTTPFVHIYRSVGEGLKAADYVAPRAFHDGSREDLSATVLPRVQAEVKSGAAVKISEDLLAELMNVLYFGVYRDKKRLMIRCRSAASFEDDFRVLTVFLYSLAPSLLQEKLSVSMSAARLSEGCKVDIVTDNVDCSAAGSGELVLVYADGALTRAAEQTAPLNELQAAVCRRLAQMYHDNRRRFTQTAEEFFVNYSKLLSGSSGGSFADNMAAYYLLLGRQKPDIADIPAANLLDSLKMSLKFYGTWPYAPRDYENLLLTFATKYLMDGASEKGGNVLKIVSEMPRPDGCAAAETLCARLLDDLYDAGQVALANETFGKDYREDEAFAEKVAAQVKHTAILGKMPSELSLDAFIQMCDNGMTRRVLFDEQNKTVVMSAFFRALDGDTPDAEWKKALDLLGRFQKSWCGTLCEYILTQKPDKFSLGIFMMMCADAGNRAVLFEKRSKNTVFDSFFHAISSEMPKENLKRAADKLNKLNPLWYKELCQYAFDQINDTLAQHARQYKIEDLCRICGRTAAAFAIDRAALWETAVSGYLGGSGLDENRLSQVCRCLKLPDSRYRAAVDQKNNKNQKKPEQSEKTGKSEKAAAASSNSAENAKPANDGKKPSPKAAKSHRSGGAAKQSSKKGDAAASKSAQRGAPAADDTDRLLKIMPVVCEVLLLILAWLIGFLFRKNPVINRDLVSAGFTALAAFALFAVFSVKNRKPFRWSALPQSVKELCKLSVCMLVYLLLRAIGA